MKGIIFTYALTYGGAVTSLFNPFNGVLVYFAFAIISPRAMWFWSVPDGRYSLTVAVALLVGWTLKGFGRWNFGAAGIIVWSFIGFFLWGVLSGRVSEYPARSHDWSIQQAKILLPFLAAVTLVDSIQKVKQIAWVLMLSQAYVAYELNLSYWAGFNRVYELGFAGMDNNCNSIAAVTGTGLAFFLGIRQKNIYLKCFCFYCAGLMAHIPMIAMSRGGMLGLCVTGVVSFFILQRKPIHYLFFALAVVLGMRLAGPAVMQRFSSTFVDEGERDKSAQSRIEMWIACWDLTLRYPIFGVGPSNWGRYAPEYEFPAGKEAHTLWLQTSAEMGFPGIGLLLAFYGFTCWRLFKLIIRPPPGIDPFHLDVARMVIAALAGFAASATFVTIIGLEIPYYICAMGAASLKVWAMESTQATQNQTWGIAPQLAGAAYAPQAQPHA